ncbi:hypothetical protein [Luteimonas vadosa]|uniref:DUF2306 domain-containing protein n=1 Tax=Luteimonas vadosa TaxID=1165507 RepID=A0ABP9E3G6_9GAMM
MDAYRLLVTCHVAAGVVALITFWLAGLSRKGGRLHRGAGKVYLVAMLGVLCSAATMTAYFFLHGRTGAAVFLGYLCVITATACWTAWRAIRDKRDAKAYFGRIYASLAWLSIGSGLATFAFGVALGSLLLATFCWIGVVAGVQMLATSRAHSEQRLRGGARWWLREHYSAMLANGVATHIAFFSIGLGRLLAPFGMKPPQLLAWMLPVAAAIAAGYWLDRKYGVPAATVRIGGAATAR